MKLTNNYNLPNTLVRAITNDIYDKGESDFSVTELIAPPQVRVLQARYDSQIEVDVADGLWRLLGSSVHQVLERAGEEESLHEKRLFMEVDGSKVSGGVDLYEKGGLVVDFKITSVYSFLLGDKPEWEQQLNCYAELYRENGFPVSRLEIHAILRDWTKSKALEHDYPRIPFLSVEIPLWTPEKAKEFLEERVFLHKNAETVSDSLLPPCTSEEMWERKTSFAVKKAGAKKATKVFYNREDAEQFLSDNYSLPFSIEVRPGKRVRCEDYCLVNKFCAQFREYNL